MEVKINQFVVVIVVGKYYVNSRNMNTNRLMNMKNDETKLKN